MRVADVMQTDVVTLTPESTLLQAQRLLLEEEINGAPVIEEDGRLVGVISSQDLVRAVQEGFYSDVVATDTANLLRRDEAEYSSKESAEPLPESGRLEDVTVADVMITEVVTISPEADVADAASAMCDQRIHRLLVVDGGRLRGIVTSFDLMGLLRR